MENYLNPERSRATAKPRVPDEFDARIINFALNKGHASQVVVGGALKVLIPDYRAEPAKEAPVEQGGV